MQKTFILTTLNSLQQSAVKALQKRVLVLAGAGSGKTKTLLQKIKFLIEDKKVQASQILAITFTKNAANVFTTKTIEMLKIVFVMIPGKSRLIITNCKHKKEQSLCAKVFNFSNLLA